MILSQLVDKVPAYKTMENKVLVFQVREHSVARLLALRLGNNTIINDQNTLKVDHSLATKV